MSASSASIPEALEQQFRDFAHPDVPIIPINGQRATVLSEPTEFYQTLLHEIRNAKRSIHLSTLYIGHAETELLQALDDALARNAQLEVRILFDGLRGTRQRHRGNSPADLFVPLVQRYPQRVHVALYHTPQLAGWRQRVYPERYNETLGLMHIKAYVFDGSTTIVSGANLSVDYFTQRQDRYVVFREEPQLARYFTQLLDVIRRFSYRLEGTPPVVGRGVVPSAGDQSSSKYRLVTDEGPDPVQRPDQFREYAGRKVQHWLAEWVQRNGHSSPTDRTAAPPSNFTTPTDSWVIPSIQMAQLGLRQDEQYFQHLLRRLDQQARTDPAGVSAQFTSAYFNFAEPIQRLILDSRAEFNLIIAAPEANGFFNARGISKYVPVAYSDFEYDFYRRAQRAMQMQPNKRITIQEYHRPGWTFHGKGLWFYLGKETTPSITVLGSSNYGYRSLERDLEAQVTLFTTNQKLRQALHTVE
ncbi:CDP-diacylglycerol--glycerol-3-phosphate 3-phosphatidyltransferase [Dimargaris cristalligena]|nr:CDP-diacylglycerol--glycerol-3-phosphate 3-phosphatidyltransferase [Dimargaris cristalligena]